MKKLTLITFALLFAISLSFTQAFAQEQDQSNSDNETANLQKAPDSSVVIEKDAKIADLQAVLDKQAEQIKQMQKDEKVNAKSQVAPKAKVAGKQPQKAEKKPAGNDAKSDQETKKATMKVEKDRPKKGTYIVNVVDKTFNVLDSDSLLFAKYCPEGFSTPRHKK